MNLRDERLRILAEMDQAYKAEHDAQTRIKVLTEQLIAVSQAFYTDADRDYDSWALERDGKT
jgi:hypothetical protein